MTEKKNLRFIREDTISLDGYNESVTPAGSRPLFFPQDEPQLQWKERCFLEIPVLAVCRLILDA